MSDNREQLGPYKLLRVIGRGGMSVVYEGFDTRFERRVAIKVVHIPSHLAHEEQSKTVARLQREARVVARLSHPNIVAIYDIGEQAGLHYLVMEFVEGITLRQRLDEEGPLSYRDAANVLNQIADALDAVHNAGVVHRDLKPLNVMLVADTDLKVKLLDFGVARPKDEENVTQAGYLVGTPAYLSPEQVSGDDVSAASDLWALGVLLYEMLSCQTPFQASSMHATLMNIVQSPPAPLSGVPEPVLDVINFALDKQPRNRFTSGMALARAYQNALRTTGLSEADANTKPSAPALPITTTQLRETASPAEAEEESAPTELLPPPPPELPVARRHPTADTLVIPSGSYVAPETTAPRPARTQKMPNWMAIAACVVLGLAVMVLAAVFRSQTRREVVKPKPTPAVSTATPTPATSDTSKKVAKRKVSPPRIERPASPKPVQRPKAQIVMVPPPPTPKPTPQPIVKSPPTPQATPPPVIVKAAPTPTPVVVAALQPPPVSMTPERETDTDRTADSEGVHEEDELRSVLADWITVNNAQDIEAQMNFYPVRLERYYTLLGVSRAHVRADKERIIGQARVVMVHAGKPTIAYDADGETAILQFRKAYDIQGGPGARRGTVLQELRLRRDAVGDWKIVSERDLRVLGGNKIVRQQP